MFTRHRGSSSQPLSTVALPLFDVSLVSFWRCLAASLPSASLPPTARMHSLRRADVSSLAEHRIGEGNSYVRMCAVLTSRCPSRNTQTVHPPQRLEGAMDTPEHRRRRSSRCLEHCCKSSSSERPRRKAPAKGGRRHLPTSTNGFWEQHR